MVDNLAESFWDSVYQGFQCETCKRCYREVRSCKRTLSRPQPIPYVGPKFYDTEKRLMFIGIESYSNKNRVNEDDLRPDIFEAEDVENLYFGKKESGIKYSPFWEWIRVISAKVLAPEILGYDDKLKHAFPRIAYSNLHKCQNRRENHKLEESSYELLETLSRNCIHEARWVYREIEAIAPKHVIVFAGSRRYKSQTFFLARLFLNYQAKNIKTIQYSEKSRWRKRNGKDFVTKVRDNERRLIVTNHPQGTPTEIRDEIIDTIKENDGSDAEQLSAPLID